MLRSLQSREFAECLLYRLDVELSAEREVVRFMGHLQAPKIENGIDDHEYMILLCAEHTFRGFG